MTPAATAPIWQETIFRGLKVPVEASEPPRALPPRDGPYIKNRFRAALGLRPI